jgi:hypothetical protein
MNSFCWGIELKKPTVATGNGSLKMILPRIKTSPGGRGVDNCSSKWVICSSGFAVQDVGFAIGGNAEQQWGRLESNRLVEPGLKIPDGPVHNDHRRAFVDANDPAKPVVEPDDVSGTQPKRMA